jgi:crossover junction endodeoxyribonuclease RuvC
MKDRDKGNNLLIMGIDPGSVNAGWGIIQVQGRKLTYVASGVLHFNQKIEFLDRLKSVKSKFHEVVTKYSPHEVALESLIYVKSPTALIKLAQARGVILSTIVDDYDKKIFEYSPNLIKSSTVGHGHADKESIQKFLKMILNVNEFKTHDESDALAVAVCHAMNRGLDKTAPAKSVKKSKASSLKNALKHKL